MQKYLFLLHLISSTGMAMESSHPIKDRLEHIHKLKDNYTEQGQYKEILYNLLSASKDQILPIQDLQALHNEEYNNYLTFAYDFSKIRLFVDAYLQGGVDGIGTCDELLSKIEAILISDKATYEEDRVLGRQMLNNYYTPELVKKAHQSNDILLISMFTKYLPLPRGFAFEYGTMPQHIATFEKEKEESIFEFFSRATDKNEALNQVIFLQRKIRSYIRKNEQDANIKDLLKRLRFTEEKARKAISDTHYPYLPQCSKDLARKILYAATQVKLWPTVKHLTSTEHLDSIFDDGLMGRRTLINMYKLFRPAALFHTDIEYGDGNVVCLGPDRIDGSAYGQSTAEVVFDFESLREENNPTCFYKSRDLGFTQKDYQKIKFGDLEISFNQRAPDIRCASHGFNYFVINWQALDYQEPRFCSYPTHPSCLHIFDNLDGLEAILSLYPFRYIDKLPTATKNKIYSELDKMNEEELIRALTDFAKKATDTAELNFYGCYLPSLEHVLEINFWKNRTRKWSMTIKDLCNELNEGTEELINKIKVDMPQLLKSYRFIDYLLAKVTHEKSSAMLLELRHNCKLPTWSWSDK